jgi:hypothetical protein
VKSEREFREVLENKALNKDEPEIRRGGPRTEQSSALDDCQHADKVSFRKEPTSERGGRNVDASPQRDLSLWSHGYQNTAIAECFANSQLGSRRNCI